MSKVKEITSFVSRVIPRLGKEVKVSVLPDEAKGVPMRRKLSIIERNLGLKKMNGQIAYLESLATRTPQQEATLAELKANAAKSLYARLGNR